MPYTVMTCEIETETHCVKLALDKRVLISRFGPDAPSRQLESVVAIKSITELRDLVEVLSGLLTQLQCEEQILREKEYAAKYSDSQQAPAYANSAAQCSPSYPSSRII